MTEYINGVERSTLRFDRQLAATGTISGGGQPVLKSIIIELADIGAI